MNRILLVLISSLWLTSVAAVDEAYVYSEIKATGTSVPIGLARQTASIGVIANYTVVLGGSYEGSTQYSNYKFSNRTWVTFGTTNYYRSGACSSQPYQTDTLTIFGGQQTNGSSRIAMWEITTFNVTSSTLSKIEPVPANIPVLDVACASSPDGSSFYVFGGYHPDQPCSGSLYEYSDNKWTQLNSTGKINGPALLGASLVFQDDFLYVFGGYCGTQKPSDATWKFSLKERVWYNDTTTVRPPGRAYHSAALDAVKNVFFTYGGTPEPRNTNVYSDTWYYNIGGNNWTQVNLTTVPPGRQMHSQVYHEGRSLIFGGRNATGEMSDLWQFVPLWNCNSLDCEECLDVLGCGWCPSSGSCVPGNARGAYLEGSCSKGDFSREPRVCLPSPWHFTPWWIAFSFVLLITCSGVFVFIAKTFCCPDAPAETYEAVN